MDFMEEILKGLSLCAESRARGEKPKRFDWVKAATILKKRNPEHAIAGLQDDMKFTAGLIWNEHKPVLRETPTSTSHPSGPRRSW